VAEKAFPGVVTVQVKTALGRTAARSKHPVAARQAIAAGAERAVAAAASGAIQPVPIPSELAIEVELRLNGAAELAAKVPGTERTGTSSVRYLAGSPRVAMDVLIVWSVLTRQYLSN
jgi:D-amino peptidase